MALVVFEEVALDALPTHKVIDTLGALLSVEVLTIVALVLAHLVVARLASLLLEGQVGREDEDSADERSHDPKAAQVFDTNISSHLDPLLEIDSLVQIASLEDQLEKDPGHMDNGYVESGSVELVLRLVHHGVVVVEQHEQGQLVQDQLLAQAHVEVVRFDIAQHGQSREPGVHHEGQDEGLSGDLT